MPTLLPVVFAIDCARSAGVYGGVGRIMTCYLDFDWPVDVGCVSLAS